MLTPEQRRQRILANSESRLARLRAVNESERPADTPPMATSSSPAPVELLRRPPEVVEEELRTRPVAPTNHPSAPSSLFSTLSSAMNMMGTLSSGSSSSNVKIENTKELMIVDMHHALVFVLGILVRLCYSFVSFESSLFFIVYLTCCVCMLTSRYIFNEMKHRTNFIINAVTLSGYRPQLVKHFVLVYTLVCDAWIIFAFYFISFCFTHVLCSLFGNH